MTGEFRILDLLADGASLRPRDLARHGIPRSALQRLRDAGRVEPCGGGFRLVEAEPMRCERAAELAAAHPDGVLCFGSALRMHSKLAGTGPLADLTDEFSAFEAVALPRGRWQGERGHGARIVTWSDPRFFVIGVDTYDMGGVLVRATTPARTVADMLRPVRNPDAQIVPVGDGLKALSVLVAAQGERAADDVARLARELGWGKHIAAVITTAKEMATWQPRP